MVYNFGGVVCAKTVDNPVVFPILLDLYPHFPASRFIVTTFGTEFCVTKGRLGHTRSWVSVVALCCKSPEKLRRFVARRLVWSLCSCTENPVTMTTPNFWARWETGTQTHTVVLLHIPSKPFIQGHNRVLRLTKSMQLWDLAPPRAHMHVSP